MELEKIKKIEESIEKLKNKTSRIYFLVQDTKGNPRASVTQIYEMAYSLKQQGYNSIIIHETKDYKGVGEWLDEKFMEIEHVSIEGQNLALSPEDFVIIPELYGHVMDQLKNFPCGKIVLCQAYDYMLETLPPGVSWPQYGFFKCITTSETQKKYISDVFRSVSVDIIEPIVSETFTKKSKPAKPIISIHTREPRDTAKIIKAFYLKYPQYRWLTFRDMRGIKQDDFSKFLQESFVSVWIDNESGFGTFPIESMLSGTPVIGKVPNLKPEWLDEKNGIWTYQFNEIVDIVANFTQNWLEDNISEELYTNMKETGLKYQDRTKYNNEVNTLFEEYFKTRITSFEEQLEKLKITEENI
jgi:hypothetical protein